MSKLTNSAATEVNHHDISSWSTTISRYLVERKGQTQSAYQNQLQNPSTDVASAQKLLFTALFEILVQRLEEGHTVLELSPAVAIAPLDDNMHTDNNSELFAWQKQLLQPLLQSLLGYIEELAPTDAMDILTTPELWNQLIKQVQLSRYDFATANRRYRACLSLYRTLKTTAKDASSIENSLSNFIVLLEKTLLISNQHLLKATPIIFKVNPKLNLTLWLHRTWQAELTLARHILQIKNQTVKPLSITMNPMLNSEQQQAIHMANESAFSIITGGPGTGKTFTVAQLVMALWQGDGAGGMIDGFGHAHLALAAPTGKAAQRMQESLQAAIRTVGIEMQLPEAKTIHRLLGLTQGGQPRYHAQNPLSEDIVIVDEASMLGVELANYLVSAIKPNARLILLGDANQLAAVDAGAVLADLCRIPALQNVHQRLEISRRFTSDSGIGKLARLINQPNGTMTDVWALLRSEDSLAFHNLNDSLDNNTTLNNSLSNLKIKKETQKNYLKYFKKTQKTLTKIRKANSMPTPKYNNDLNELMNQLNKFKILTAGHNGQCGDIEINHHLSQQHRQFLKLPLSKSPWYHGRPVMILQNNYELGLFNGDIGICMQTKEDGLQVFFENKAQGIAINRLSDDMVTTAYAMTIHKSQGSEFDHVAICFDDQNARLLSQELIYTAVTRAKKQVTIFSTPSALSRALKTPTVRQTGLALQFEQLENKS